MTIENVDALLAPTTRFMKSMHVVTDDFALRPHKPHIATCINFSDLIEMREIFIRELRDLVPGFVYSADKQRAVVANIVGEGEKDAGAAWSELIARAHGKFRSSNLKGQFCEILLCVLLQHHFRAVPALRKMSITTSPEVERHGADALHIACDSGAYRLYLGEAKSYGRRDRALWEGLSAAITDLLQKHLSSHRQELWLHVFEDHLSPQLEDVVRSYLDGTLKVEMHLVAIVAYDADIDLAGLGTREQRLERFVDHIRTGLQGFAQAKVFQSVDPAFIPRLNYILFPVKEIDALVKAFSDALMGRI